MPELRRRADGADAQVTLLRELERRRLALVADERRVHERHPRLFEEVAADRGQVGPGGAAKGREEIAGGGIAVGMVGDVAANGLLEALLAEETLEHVEHRLTFVVGNADVEAI